MSDPESGGTEVPRERSIADTQPVSSTGEPPEEKRRTPKPGPESEILSRLTATTEGKARYRMRGEIARGGMGAIWQVWDSSLDRSLAMKVILGSSESSPPGVTAPVDQKLLARFLEEAQVTSQLDHPGVVPVHELGVDAEGRVFFTMKLVKGRDLKAIFDLVFSKTENWNDTRALGVLLKVCEAMAYAHAKGVIHRDLKPGNVMVGDFGEVYVMDWGLARVMGRKDSHDLRLLTDGAALSSLRTERRKEREEAPDSPLITMDGIVVGTPAYMPPEQARGDIDALGPRSDVYSIGAMLYHLLARQMPYVPPGTRISSRTLLVAALDGPPKPLASIRRDVPAELVAIVEKAMARESANRYATTLELAEDLRAYIENRVVRAYETGPVAELRKWVVRNKPLAATIAAALLALVAALFLINDARLRADDARADAHASAIAAKESEADAREHEAKAEAAAEEAKREKDEVLRLADVQRMRDLEIDSARLWPAVLENAGGIEEWLGRARELAGRLPAHRARLAELRGLASKRDADQVDAEALSTASRLARLESDRGRSAEAISKLEAEGTAADTGGETLGQLRGILSNSNAEIARLEKLLADQRNSKFERDAIAWQRGVMADLVQGIENLTRDDRNWSAVTIEALERRLEFAKTVRRVTIDDEKVAWDEAIARIRASEKYGGLDLAPQMDLVPLWEDPASGLFEFWHVQSGEKPRRGEDGKIVPHEEMGFVLVLIPGGTFTMGSPASEGERLIDEGPQHEVTLDAYFLSKYEMTQAQWIRFAGRNPSNFKPPQKIDSHVFTLLNPVEQVSWEDCAMLLPRFGLEIPTEAQWERAARGGTSTPWCFGADRDALRNKANIADETYARAGGNKANIDIPKHNDGFAVHAPVGAFPASPYGLHEVIGNVWEWCRDWSADYRLPVSPVDGERQVPISEREARVGRGGSFGAGASGARSAARHDDTPEYRAGYLGVRPSRRVKGE